MDAFDLSQQGIVHVDALSEDLIGQIEDGSANGYALTLAQNRIAHVRDVSSIFQHVVQLDLSGNRLTTLDGIQTLRQLEGLNLSCNRIESIDLLASLPKLGVLIASENNIVQIDALCSSTSLKTVNVNSNNLTTWPSLGQLGALESLDVSDNLLSAFPPAWTPKLFPGSLLHLSIARNQIHELCGIAALGSHLTRLQSLNMDGNPAVLNLLHSEGALQTLYANGFASLLEIGDECLNPTASREAYLMPRNALLVMSRAIQSGDEAVLLSSLRNGLRPHEQAAPQAAVGSNTPKATGTSAQQESGIFKVTELSPPQLSTLQESSLNSASTAQIATSSALSKADKMEMWKRIQDERKAQERKEKDRPTNEAMTPRNASASSTPRFLPPSTTASQSMGRTQQQQSSMYPPPPPPPVAKSSPTNDMRSSPPQLILPAKASPEMKTVESKSKSEKAKAPTEAVSTKSAPSDALVAQVHSLQEQVSTLRKYIKVWIKREQMLRALSAIRIQRFLRQRQAQLILSQRLTAKRHERQLKYSFAHCSSHLLPQLQARTASEQLVVLRHFHAQSIQCWVRGWLTRCRLLEWKRKIRAATTIKNAWKRFRSYRNHLMERYLPTWFAITRRHRLGNHYHQQGCVSNSPAQIRQEIRMYVHLRCLRDVNELQRSFVAQQQATVRLWDDMTSVRRFLDYHMTKAVVRIQSHWRGYLSRKQHHQFISRRCNKPNDSPRMQQQLELQALEIHELREQISSLHRLVQGVIIQPQPQTPQVVIS